MSLQTNVKALLISVLVAGGFSSALLVSAETLEDRIKPVGQTCMVGDACAAAASSAASGEPRSGADVYSANCMACHSTGAAGAPKLGDAAVWLARLDAKGLEGLYNSAINGINAMPAKGGCANCSDDEVKAAIDHMLEKSK